MDEDGSAGTQDEMKEENVSLKEAIKKGMNEADDTCVQSQEETVSLFSQTGQRALSNKY